MKKNITKNIILTMLMALVILGLFAGTASAGVPTFTAARTDVNTIVLTFNETVNCTSIADSFTVVNATSVTNTAVNDSTSVTLTTVGLTATDGTPEVNYVATTGDIVSVSTSEEVADGGAIAAADQVAPTVVSAIFTDAALKVGETSLVTFTFSEAITGFANDDLTIVNGVLTAVTDAGAGTIWTATFTPTDDLEDATNVITVAMTGVADTATNAGIGTTDSSNYAIDTKEPMLSSWILDMDAKNTTLTFSEIVDASTLAVGSIVIQDAATAGTTYTLTDSSTASSDGTAIVINLSATDFNALTADAALAISQATSYVTIAATAIDDMAGNDVTAITDTSGVQATTFTAETTAPTLSSWVLDMNAQTATLTFSETVNASSLNVTAITIQDAATATTSYTLTDSTTASSNGAAIVIDLSTTDFNALTANTGLAVSQATSYVTIAATAIDDMAANDVTAITDDSGVQATTFTAVPAAPSTDDDGGRPNLPAPLPNVITTEGKGLILSEPAASVTLDFGKGEVMSIVVDAKDVMDSIYITVQKLEGKPADVAVSAPGNVHSYININVGKVSGEIAGANIAFKIEKKWLSQNNIAKDNVMLARFSEGVWQDLETTVLNGDDDFVHFSARTPGFSTFAIVAKEVAVTEPVDEVEAPVSVEEPAPEVVAEVSAPVEEEGNGLPGFEAIFAVMGLLLVTLLVRKQEKN